MTNQQLVLSTLSSGPLRGAAIAEASGLELSVVARTLGQLSQQQKTSKNIETGEWNLAVAGGPPRLKPDLAAHLTAAARLMALEQELATYRPALEDFRDADIEARITGLVSTLAKVMADVRRIDSTLSALLEDVELTPTS